MAYKKDTDYSALIKDAVSKGNYRAAAQYEQQRNEKIADLNATGGNKWGAAPTNNYASWSDSYTGSANDVGVWTQDQDAIRQKMNEKSKQWLTADEATRAALHAENQYLASLLGEGVTFDPTTGYWSGNANGTAAQQAAGMVAPSFTFDVARPTYESNYSGRIDALLDQILNREDFSYDVESDPLYQQYKAQYNREGDRSMRDTLAEVASGAGGMNSYAVSAAQQANNYYAAQLTDKIPELYQLAYQMYLNDIDNQVRDLGLLQDMDNTQYGRYRDTMSDWYADRDFAYGQYRDDVSDYQWAAGFNYNAGRDTIEDEWRQTQFDYSAGRDDESDRRYNDKVGYERAWDKGDTTGDYSGLKAYGYSDEDIAKLEAAWEAKNNPPATSPGTKFETNPPRTTGPRATSGDEPPTPVDLNEPNKSNANNVSTRAREIYDSLKLMVGQMGSEEAIANSIALSVDTEGLSDADARWLFEQFGYDPDEWLD